MKNIVKLFVGLLLLTGIVFTGCKEASELTDVIVPANYEAEFDISVVPSSSDKSVNGVFSASEIIDPASDSEYEKYFDKIKGISITEFSGIVLTVNPNITLISTVVSVSNPNFNATWEFFDFPVTVGSVITLDNDNGQWDIIEKILMQNEPFTVSINGEVDEDNAEFVVLLKIKSDITANPLN